MNRRNFLKSLGKVCGAAVVAPAVLLRARKKPIEVEWTHLYDEFHYSNEELAKRMKQAFKNTKFKRPLPYGLHGYKERTVMFRGKPVVIYETKT